MLQPHLTLVHFENCPFLFEGEFQFDFSKLEKLEDFRWSESKNDALMKMLETIQSNKLLHLDISNNIMDFKSSRETNEFLVEP